MWRTLEPREMHACCSCEDIKWKRLFEDKGIDRGILSGFIWLRIWTSSLLLWMQHWTLRLCQMPGISWQADHLSAFIDWICCFRLVKRNYLNGICHFTFDVSDWMGIQNYKGQLVEAEKKITFPANMSGTAFYPSFWFWEECSYTPPQTL
jgi:hypothetical protein